MGIVEAGPQYGPPVAIAANHRPEDFSCGKQPLDDWLKAHALDNEGKGSRTYVVTSADSEKIVGYYAIAAGSVVREDVPRKLRHGLPNPMPVMVLGRLAVDLRHLGAGIGSAMLREAMQRTIAVSQTVGIRALVVHAIDDDAAAFYAKYGFQQFPAGTRTMFLSIETLAASL